MENNKKYTLMLEMPDEKIPSTHMKEVRSDFIPKKDEEIVYLDRSKKCSGRYIVQKVEHIIKEHGIEDSELMIYVNAKLKE